MYKHGYMKEGKGVEKRDSDEFGISLFFELYFRKFGKLIKLNLLYLAVCIPTFLVVFAISGLVSSRITNMSAPVIARALGTGVPNAANSELRHTLVLLDIAARTLVSFAFTVFWGMGPVTAGYTYILRNYAREEHIWLISDFFGKAKQNFAQALVVWIIDLAVFAVLVLAGMFYASQDGAMRYLFYAVASIMLVYTIMHFYIYQCMITFKLSLGEIFKNSLIFTLIEAPRNLLILFVLLAIHFIIPYAAMMLNFPWWFGYGYVLAEILILTSTSGFIVNFWIYPTIRKYIREAEEKTDTATCRGGDDINDIQGLL